MQLCYTILLNTSVKSVVKRIFGTKFNCFQEFYILCHIACRIFIPVYICENTEQLACKMTLSKS